MFHISQLKKAEGVFTPAASGPPLTDEVELMVTPADVLQVRHMSTGRQEVLVAWEGVDPSEATWEDVENFLLAFPLAHLENKVHSLVGGIVVHEVEKPILKTYHRRVKKAGTAGSS